jgi:triphosphoribosyl-dephospho-CoA synthetase
LGDQNSRLAALRWLIVHSEDTVLLKRASSYDNYHLIKERFRQLNLDDPAEVEAWDRYCVNHRLSFGGSADLLVLSFFLRRMQGTFF